ncbi:MAG TPA: hypothetical protein VFT61_08910 [Sphingomicrobium sp.]|nr:hypothetical protein [Sphingomicrobium sp.]
MIGGSGASVWRFNDCESPAVSWGLGTGPVKLRRQGSIAEIDRHTSGYLPIWINVEPNPAIAVKEAQTIVTFISADAAFANAGDRIRTHQPWQIRSCDIQQRSKFLRIDHDVAVGDLDPHDLPMRL